MTQAKKIKDVPLWVFHGAKDRAIKPEYSIKMVEAIQAAGGKPGFTLYPDVDHPAWLHAYSDPMLLRWMFAQRKAVVKNDPTPDGLGSNLHKETP